MLLAFRISALLVTVAFLSDRFSLIISSLIQEVNEKLQILKKKLRGGDSVALGEIRQTVLQLAAPPQLVCILLVEPKMFLLLSLHCLPDSIIRSSDDSLKRVFVELLSGWKILICLNPLLDQKTSLLPLYYQYLPCESEFLQEFCAIPFLIICKKLIALESDFF